MRVRSPDKPKPDQFPSRPPRHHWFWPFGLFRQLITAVASGGLLLALMAAYGFWRSGPRFIDGLRLMVSPPPPEERVDVRTVVVQQVRNASELTTAVFSMEAVVPATSDRTFAGYVIGQTNLLYIAYGEVRAGIDLSQVSITDVSVLTVGDQDVLEVTLPAPRILDSKIDVDRSKVYDYTRGFLSLGPDRAPQLQELAQKTALVQIEDAACEQGILQSASDRSQQVVRQLLTNLGYADVRVTVKPFESCLPSSPPEGIEANP
jgi:hypothetical protein